MSHTTIKKEEVFQKIADASLFGNLNLFIGAGFSKAIFESEIGGPLTWIELLQKTCDALGVKFDEKDKQYTSCPEIASKICQKICGSQKSLEEATMELKEKICELTSWYPSEQQRDRYSNILKKLNPQSIVTTNYDLILEGLLPNNSRSLGPNDALVSSRHQVPILHLHGVRTNPNSIIITQEDYIKLFRPNEYRLHKLSLLFKETTTLIIGYSLGDPNVLTALDWSKNIYQNDNIDETYYPNSVIQIIYKKDNPNTNPEIKENGIIILESSSILDTLNELSEFIEKNNKTIENKNKKLIKFKNVLINANDKLLEKFITKKEKRNLYIGKVQKNSEYLIEEFLIFLTKVFDKCWEKARPNGAFYAYKEMLLIVLDIFINIPFNKMSPALFESIAYQFGRASSYIGNSLGQSYAAYGAWNDYKNNIPEQTKKELKLYFKHSVYSSSAIHLLE
ncbi:SIR2 family NAD-dependent protein deacylase [Campylobacter sp. MOP7]|uniref:SIR2 family NAD-dependent protein deacylase n=1 Tax=Campylobacter canis TaxID=3378588 RepID=UPI00387EC390